MKWSHSKLKTIMTCPMTYYLSYEQGIFPKVEKSALSIGTAVHWGIEHNTEDLEEYYKEKGTFKQGDNYTRDQLLAEAMIHGYFKHKDELFEKLLTSPKTNEKLELLDEVHELYLTANLQSKLVKEGQPFVGIIDLLLTTNEGFVLVDYKTSTYVPNWDNYKDQLYRYMFELKQNFPDIPVVKIAIINIRKTNIRQKKNENEIEFLNRMKFEYDINDENYVNYHEYTQEDIDQSLLSMYIDNLSKECDTAKMIIDNRAFYINYENAIGGQYGRSEYYDIFFKTPGAEAIYKINDYIWNDEKNDFDKERDCLALDMQVIKYSNVLNHYETFEKELLATSCESKEDFFKELSSRYRVDIDLLNVYWTTYVKKKEVMKNARQQ